MLTLLELIIYFNGRLQEHPPISSLNWHEVCDSTLAYLNCYRQTEAMLKDLAKDVADITCQAGGS